MELDFLLWIQQHLRAEALDPVFVFFTRLGDGGFLWILLCLALLVSPRTRPYGWMVGAALVAGLLLGNLALKNLVARPRPFQAYPGVRLLVAPPTDYSFPSGHTLASFEAAGVLCFSGKRLGLLALAAAVLISFSRLYLFLHYPTDVLGGLLLGLAIAWCVVRIFRRKGYLDHAGTA